MASTTTLSINRLPKNDSTRQKYLQNGINIDDLTIGEKVVVPGSEEIVKDTYYKTDDKGQKIKVTRTIKRRRTIRAQWKSVLNKEDRLRKRRERWTKFGKCSDSNGVEYGITDVGDVVNDIFYCDRNNKEKDEQIEKDKNEVELMYKQLSDETIDTTNSLNEANNQPKQKKWIPPHKRKEGIKSSGGNVWNKSWESKSSHSYIPPSKISGRRQTYDKYEDDDMKVRVSNLDDDITEDDLSNAFGRYGQIKNLFMGRDKETKLSLGFSYITFETRKDAERAYNMMKGKPLGYSIIQLEWAKSVSRAK